MCSCTKGRKRYSTNIATTYPEYIAAKIADDDSGVVSIGFSATILIYDNGTPYKHVSGSTTKRYTDKQVDKLISDGAPIWKI